MGYIQKDNVKLLGEDKMVQYYWDWLQNALIKEKINDATAIDLGVILGRESAFVANLGADVVVLQGTNALFHLQKDRWPISVDVEKITKLSKSFNQIAFELANAE